MKEHILREMINELTRLAMKYHDCQQLRERLKGCVFEYLEKDREWYREFELLSRAKSGSE